MTARSEEAKDGSSLRHNEEIQIASHRIHAALAPRIAVLSSADVDEVLAPNNFDSFADLLKPFQESIENLTVRTSQLETRQCKTFPLSFDHFDLFGTSHAVSTSSLFTPADIVGQSIDAGSTTQSPPKAKRRTPAYSRPEILLDAISARISSKSKALWESRANEEVDQKNKSLHRRKPSVYSQDVALMMNENDLSSEGIDLPLYREAEIDSITPWFADTRDMVLHARQISEHETFGHPMAAILVVSASSSDPMNAFANLFEESQPHANSAFNKRPYVDPLIFRYYVLLHDVSKSGSELTESLALLENVKKTYGLHCCLLPINSAEGKSSNSGEEISSLWQRVLRNTSSYATSPPQDDTVTSSPKKRQSLDALSKWHGGSTTEEEKVYASLINDDDVRKIKTFVRDFAAQSLIPFMERCVSLWNDQLAASRRGLTGRLLGAGRKFFGGASSRNSASSQPTQSFSTLGYYPHTALEAQTRRLADFAFMTHDYKLAASMYDLCRKDFSNDKANKYIAGANEMFGLSHLMLMMGTPNALIDVDSYLAAAGTFYLAAPRQKGSSLQLEGLRATLLYYEAYRGLNFYRSAPSALVRTANEGSSEDENDLEVVAAMLLEQAALVNLRQSGKPALRKCALHLIMAAHRYRKCGQKHLSLRCFRASAQIYRMLSQGNTSSLSVKDEEYREEGGEDDEKLADIIAKHERVHVREWEVINDHMEYEMAQQAFNDGNIAQALAHYVRILQRQSTSFEASDPESTLRHETYLQGFATCCKYLEGDLTTILKSHGINPSLNIVDSKLTYIEVNASTQSDDIPWRALEERVLGQSVSKTYKEQNTTAIDETFWLHICVRNPFNVQLTITSLTANLVHAKTGDTISDDIAEIKSQDSFTLAPLETRIVSLAAICHSASKLKLSQIRYGFGQGIELLEAVVKVGKRLNDTKEHRTASEPVYAPNESIAVIVHESKAILEASFVNASSRLGLGEEVEATINFANVGKAPLKHAQLHLNRPDTLVDPNSVKITSGQLEEESFDIDNCLQAAQSIAIPFPEETLSAGDTFSWKVILRGSALGFVTLRALIVFEAQNGEKLTAQLQHTIQIDPVVDLSIQALPSRSEKMQYQLRLDASNLLQHDQSSEGEPQNIVIDGLSVVGPCWMVDDNNGKDILEAFKSIKQQERRSTELFVTPSGIDKETQNVMPISDLSFTVDQLRSILTGRGLNKSISTPATHLTSSKVYGDQQSNLQLSRFFFLARKEYRLATLSHDFPSLLVRREGGDKRIDEFQQLRQIFTLYEPNEVDIIAHWHISSKSGQTRHGQAFIFGLRLGPSIDYLATLFSIPKASEQEKAVRTMYAETEREKAAIWQNLRSSRLHVEDDPILFDFKLPTDQAKKHDFAQSGRKVVDVEFVVQNLSPLSTRKVILKLDNISPPSGNTAAIAAITSATGKTFSPIHASYVERLTLMATVAPLSRTTLRGKASIPRAGRVIFAPVLITNLAIVEDEQNDINQKKPFQRWEYCSQYMDIE